ncbi:MAG TPA: HD-GYP domain-containing protein [Permianibacter sp.]|nr:HD-GYP domain-containing protein [Permianibacter sp.]
MLKRLPVTALKPGMYVVEISRQSGGMLVKTEGALRDQAAIAALSQLGIEEVIVDTARQQPSGDETAAGKPAPKSVRSASKPMALERALSQATELYDDALKTLAELMAALPPGQPLPSEATRSMVRQFMGSLLRNQDALICLAHLRDRDRYLLEHALNSSILMTVFARALQLPEPEVEQLALAALWHDIGKIRIDAAVLDKPGRLTAEEFREVRRHVEYGLDMTDKVPGVTALMRAAIAHHHERLDGNGYPNKLRGDEISRAGRMMAIVDSYDAMTAPRLYRSAVTAVRAFKVLRADSYALYDAELVMAFIKAIGFYPAGSLVKLKSQRLAFVLAANPDKPYQPLVKVFYHARFRQPLPVQDVDLADPDCDDDIEASVRPEQFKLDLLQFFRTVVLPA